MPGTKLLRKLRYQAKRAMGTKGRKGRLLLKWPSLKVVAVASIMALTVQLTAPILGFAPNDRAAIAAGTAYYVSPTGSDSNSGSSTAPWKTPAKAFSTAKAGDTVYFKAGTYTVGGKLAVQNSGTSSAPITFAGDPSEQGKPVFNLNESDSKISVSGKNHIDFRGIHFKGKSGVTITLVEISGRSAGVRFFNDTFSDSNEGVEYKGNSDSDRSVTDGLIYDCEFYNFGNPRQDNPLSFVRTQRMTVKNSYLHDANSGEFIHFKESNDGLVEGSTLHTNIDGGGRHEDGIMFTHAQRVTLRGNVIYDIRGGRTLQIGGSIGTTEDITVVNNVLWDPDANAVDLWQSKNIKFYNNTIVAKGYCFAWGTSSNVVLKNNILVGEKGWQYGGQSTSGSNNLIKNGSIPSSWSASIKADPQFATYDVKTADVTSWHLKNTSPAINKGLAASQDGMVPKIDYRTYDRDTTPDIGAFEYGATGTTDNVTSPTDTTQPEDTATSPEDTTTSPEDTTAPSADTTPPTVSFAMPADGAVVSGSRVFTKALPSDNVGVSKVEFYIDGELEAIQTLTPYDCGWDSTTVSDGAHKILAKVYDTAGNTASAEITVTVKNSVVDMPPAVPVPEVSDPGAEVSVTYPAGWNMVAVPAQENTAMPFYSYDPATESYVTVDSPVAGIGYWVYYESTTTVTMTLDITDTADFKLHAGWNMIGNPFDRDVTVPSGYVGYAYDPISGAYSTTSAMPKGSSIWVYVTAPQTLTLHR